MSDTDSLREQYRHALGAIVRQVPGNSDDEYKLVDAVLAVRDREMTQLRVDLAANDEEVARLSLHNDATCEAAAERDRLDTELERLRAGLRSWPGVPTADASDLITKGHVARRISALLEGGSA